MADIANPAGRLLNYRLSNEVGADLVIETIDKKKYIVLQSKSGKILSRQELSATLTPTVLSSSSISEQQLSTIFTDKTLLLQYNSRYYILSSISGTQLIYTSTGTDDSETLAVSCFTITKSDSGYSCSVKTVSGGSGTAVKYIADDEGGEPYIEF